jgi:WD40 repeat protein
MTSQSANHPSREQLSAFGLGLLESDQSAAVESHVDECQECCQSLLTVADDSLVSRLRDAAATGSDGLAAPHSLTVALTGPDPSPVDESPVVPAELASHPRYRIEKLLGAGGMGAVYRAYHQVMDRPVALKIINPSVMTKPGMVQRFTREVRTAARLSHPNIVAAFDAEQAGGLHFLVMEYVDGTDLGRLVQERGPLGVDRACDYIRQAALGLQHAFEQGMVHRDIKPHNLMVTPDDRVKILDFGLALFASEAAPAAGITATGIVLGTVDYIAPEQADNAHQADIRSDIYSLGCTLYHLLAGRPPFPTGTSIQKVMAHVEKIPQPLTELRPHIPEKLMLVLDRMMAKNPKHRYQTPDEVALALEPFTFATAIPRAPKSQSRARATDDGRTVLLETTAVRGRKRRRIVIAASILLFLVVGLLGTAVYRIATDKGELVITTESDDVEVVIKQGGKEVSIIDPKTEKSITLALRSGDYELELKGAPEGLKLTLDKATLTRGETVLAKIELVGATTAGGGKIGEIRRFVGHADGITAVAFSPDGHHILTGAMTPGETFLDVDVQLWHATTGKELRRLTGQRGVIYAVSFSADGKRVVASSYGPSPNIRVWDVGSGKVVREFSPGGNTVFGVAFTADSEHVLSCEGDPTVRKWNIESGKVVRQYEGLRSVARCLAVSRDGRFLACGGCSQDGTILVWEVETGREVQRFEGHKWTGEPGENCIAFSPDGKQILSGGYDGTVRLWSISDGKEIQRFTGHTGAIGGVAYAPDGSRILSGGYNDRTVRLWDARTGKELHRFTDHTKQVTSVACSPDGRFAVSGSADNTARLWRLPDPPPAKEKP